MVVMATSLIFTFLSLPCSSVPRSILISLVLLLASTMPTSPFTLDENQETRADKFGDFVFENGLLVRVTEAYDFIGNATTEDPTDLDVDTTTIYSDYYSLDGTQTERVMLAKESENPDLNNNDNQTEFDAAPLAQSTFSRETLNDSTVVDVEVFSYHNYSALVELLDSLEQEYGDILTR